MNSRILLIIFAATFSTAATAQELPAQEPLDQTVQAYMCLGSFQRATDNINSAANAFRQTLAGAHKKIHAHNLTAPDLTGLIAKYNTVTLKAINEIPDIEGCTVAAEHSFDRSTPKKLARATSRYMQALEDFQVETYKEYQQTLDQGWPVAFGTARPEEMTPPGLWPDAKAIAAMGNQPGGFDLVHRIPYGFHRLYRKINPQVHKKQVQQPAPTALQKPVPFVLAETRDSVMGPVGPSYNLRYAPKAVFTAAIFKF